LRVTETSPVVWLISDDLFFLPTVEGHAKRAGLAVKMVSRPEETELPESFRGALIDLQSPVEWKSFVAKAQAERPGAKFIAFGPHVAAQLLQDAAAAGCSAVVTKGQLHRDGTTLLASFA
jgi:hypothetical protein